jgi:hypothetical protein
VRWLPLFAVTVLGACGTSEPQAEILLPWPDALTCATPSNLDGMEATLTVASYAPCPLEVQPDLSVRGTCPNIATNVVRSLLVAYFLPQTSDPPIPIAYAYGTIDLTANGPIDADTKSVQVVLGDALVITPAQVAALPASASKDDPPSVKTPAWARQVIEAEQLTLDLDCDDAANIVEACAGTLLPASGTCP